MSRHCWKSEEGCKFWLSVFLQKILVLYWLNVSRHHEDKSSHSSAAVILISDAQMYFFLLTSKKIVYSSVVMLSKIWWKKCISHSTVPTWLVAEVLVVENEKHNLPGLIGELSPIIVPCPDLSIHWHLAFNLKLAVTRTMNWLVSWNTVLCETELKV